MKVVFLLPNLGAGGAERVVTILSRAFVREGISVDIVLLLTDKVQYEVPEGVQLVKLNTYGQSSAARLKQLRAYFREQKKSHPQMTAVPFQDNCLQYTLVATAGLGIPVVACERNDPHQKGEKGIARWKANLPYLLAARCVFQTLEARDYYVPAVGKKAAVIANPLVLPEELVWRGQNEKKIISVGRLDPQKNQKMLIDAFSQLHRKFPEYILEIYGEGSLREQLQAQIRDLDLENAVFLRGHAGDIHRRLTGSSLFVLSSDYEGMSNALIEALAIGVPTVSTDHPIGGARMLIENGVNGILTPVGDSRALAEAMEQVLRDPDLAQSLGRNGMNVRNRLAADRIAQQWMKTVRF